MNAHVDERNVNNEATENKNYCIYKLYARVLNDGSNDQVDGRQQDNNGNRQRNLQQEEKNKTSPSLLHSTVI